MATSTRSHGLTPTQTTMLFQVLGSDSDLYAIRQRIDVPGDLSTEAVREAWSRLTEVHPMLRARFDWTSGEEPVQIIEPRIEPAVEVIDVSHGRLEQAVTTFIATTPASLPLDVAPSWRFTVFRDGMQSVAIWDHNHLMLDGWSTGLLMHQFLDLVDDPSLLLDIPELVFGDYVDWINGRDDDADEDFWRATLTGLPSPTSLRPLDHAGPPNEHRVTVSLDQDRSAALINRLRRLRLTPNTAALAATAAVVGAHLDLDEVVLAIAAAGRPAELDEAEHVVGMFTNTIAARIPVTGARTVDDWLKEIQFDQFDALEHRYTPFARITKVSPFPTGLTDVLFAHWGFDSDSRYAIREASGPNGFPLSVIAETAETISVHIDADTGSIDPGLGRILAERIVGVLRAIADGAEGLQDLPIVPDEEIASIVQAGAGPTDPFSSILDSFAHIVASRPAAVAIGGQESTLTYEALDRSAQGLASLLRRKSSPVAVWMERSPDLIVAILGCLLAGRPFIPIGKYEPPARVSSILADGGVTALITPWDPPSDDVDIIRPGSWEASDPIPSPTDPHSLAYVIYTSGSTGAPKGVPITLEAISNYITWAASAYGSPVTMPFFTSVGFDLTITSILLPLTTGGTVIVYPDADPLDMSVVDVFTDDQVDIVKLTPSHLRAVPDEALHTSRISALVLGGEDLPTAAALRAHEAGLVVHNEYGPTEATVGCMIHTFDPSTDVEPSVPIGTAIANTEVGVFDHDGTPKAIGIQGELWVTGIGLTPGYLGRPDLDEAAFRVQEGRRWYRTGDQAKWLRPGTAAYLGRSDEQVKLRGVRIELGEIEAVLNAHPDVRSAALKISEHGERKIAIAYISGGATTDELQRWVRDRLPQAMHPDRIVPIDEIPLTSNGKIDRARLPVPMDTAVGAIVSRRPETETEQRVARHVQALLDISDVDMEARFFDLGGDSILAMQLVTRLRSEFETPISPRSVLLNSLGQIAAEFGTTSNSPDNATRVERRVMRFGEGLFGLLVTPLPVTVGTAVICPPYGWEYMRTHWALRQTAKALVRRGWTVLRFDYHGTGDSIGEVVDTTRLDDFVDDIDAAVDQIRTSGLPMVVVGARLGGALAVRAAARRDVIDRLVLWDPVVSGQEHIATITSINNRYLRRRFLRPQRRTSSELIGAPYPAGLRKDLSSLDLAAIIPPVPTTVVASFEDDRTRALAAAGYDIVSVPDVGGWDQPRSVFTSVLPRKIPEAVAQEVDPS